MIPAPVTDAGSRGDASGALARIDVALREFTRREPRPGLLNGYGGAALFHAYHFLWTRDERHLDQAHQVIGRTLDAVAAEHPGPSFCSGLAGIAWSLQHLVRIGLVEPDDSAEVFAQVDDLLAPAMDAALAGGRHDFLHEGLGIALYFVERLPDPAARVQLERAVARLEATAVGDGRGGLRWLDRFTRRGREAGGAPCYNLGLAHGVPAIIAVLALLHDHGVARAQTAPLLRGATRWLRATRLPETARAASLFPILVDADDRPLGPTQSRLGWCYGDLAVATALGRAGAALDDRDLVDEAHRILRHTCAHRTADNGAIEDASLCHGSMGVSHMLRRAARDGDAELRDGADRWLDHTLSLGAGPGGSAGFQCWREDHFVDCFDLLQGITGIGLGLLAAVDRDTPPAWDRCLLLS